MTFFMKDKKGVQTCFQQYRAYVKTQRGNELKCLRIDNGREYLNQAFKKFLKDNGIRLELTAPHSPAQNGISERLNRTLAEHGRAMLIAHDIPYFLWPEAISYATYLMNRSLT